MDRVYVMQLVRSYQAGELSQSEFLQRTARVVGSAAAETLLAAAEPRPAVAPPMVVITAPEADAPAIAMPSATTGKSDANQPHPARLLPDAESGLPAILGETIRYPGTEGEVLTGYLAQQESGGRWPGVVVIQEWWGLNDHIKDVVRRFAQAGFVGLAPDLYHGLVVSEPDEARKAVMELDLGTAVQEIRQAIRTLATRDNVLGPKVGLVGFCMGGRLVLRTSLVEPQVGAAVVFYGSPLKPEEARELKAPLLGLYGAQDQGNPVDSVRAMEQALNDAGIENEFHIYDAPHAFFNDTRDSYREDAARDAWQHTLDWLREHVRH